MSIYNPILLFIPGESVWQQEDLIYVVEIYVAPGVTPTSYHLTSLQN